MALKAFWDHPTFNLSRILKDWASWPCPKLFQALDGHLVPLHGRGLALGGLGGPPGPLHRQETTHSHFHSLVVNRMSFFFDSLGESDEIAETFSFFLFVNKQTNLYVFFVVRLRGHYLKIFCWGCESIFDTWLVMKMYKGFQWFLSHAGFYCPWCCLGGTLGRPIKVFFCCCREISLPHLKTNSNVWRIWKIHVGWVKIFYNSHWHM